MENNGVIAFLAIVLVLALLVFVVFSKLGPRRKPLDRDYYADQWQRISKLAEGTEAEWHVAVFDADKLLDHALKARGFRGQTMGDRLKNARQSLPRANAVWQAHKLRNRLAHETGVSLQQSEVSAAMSGFAAGLKDLGAL